MSLNDHRVRVVAGERSRALVLSEWLSDCFETTVETSGAGALERISAVTDVVVVSQGLSDMRAWEFLDGLRADGYDCRVVLLTDSGVTTGYEERDSGRVIERPLNPEALREAVDDAAGIPDPKSPGPEPATN